MILFIQVSVMLYAAGHKNIKKSFSIEPGKLIEIETVSGLDINVKSWDKDEVYFDLRLKVTSSDEELEAEYVEYFDIIEKHRNSKLVIKFDEEEVDGGWSFWDIFRGRFYFDFSKEIKGNIYVPRANPLKADFKYSIIRLDDMLGEINLIGRSNELYLNNCGNIFAIENDYGDNFILNSGGELNLNSRSGNVTVDNFEGPIKIIADYSKIDVRKVKGILDVKTRSANVNVEDIDSDLKMSADYSDVIIKNINGFADLKNRSGKFDVTNVKGIRIDAPYTTCNINGVSGIKGKDIEISDRSGHISIEKATGNVVIDDSYSDITLKSIDGNVNLTSRSSTVIGSDIKGNWESGTNYCTIQLEKFSGKEIVITNRSDPVIIGILRVPELVDIENDFGNIEFALPGSYNGEINLYVSHGEIKSGFPIKIKKGTNSSKVNEKLGNGNSKIILRADHGSIYLEKN
jgi:DUF4097 and DUF4098 domain-containing protein YvlB